MESTLISEILAAVESKILIAMKSFTSSFNIVRFDCIHHRY